ncbi:GNAT family N-acetyltransferase [Novosphingobium sp. Fuku2-ISO-50]|uniref:GNAT family N-acetyltransferase n=1 Tax=Novosphingobium sp. Fuku2-ISO-50 TaxID=1739114 RepID=UPI00076D63F2|nr:GNAT family N-acetyltransferase [Novosphingobium sp. Fuku2-ISO-50]KUR78863.1 acetyltransferase [Novosphingobium sp. Fuku2-ISO-50]
MADIRIVEDDLTGEAIRALVALHLAAMHEHSPPDKVHALPIAALRASDVTFYSAWIADDLAGMGAIRRLADDHGEIKSMRVAPAFLGRGMGEAILRHLLGVARARGYARVSLETGRTGAFGPAVALYRKYGFVECPAFADYVLDGFSQCMTLALAPAA